MARPTLFSEEIADRICDELMGGKSLVKICEADDMPSRSTVIRWMAVDERFATRCARARDAQADYMDDLILEVADSCTPDNAAAARVKIAAYQWRASKLAPKKYGDRLDLNHSGSIQQLSDEQLESRLTELLGKGGTGLASGGSGTEEG